ncbi:MAG TPA: ribosomal protein S18-alanine N-acetyltransferase [Anaerolineae bacterium]|jgi:ribosomal-protein-alanine N-acetyltransferase|nr:ribosomal protein S18-alanine N-acetyltransferase [Anaerolineae bacterium]
MTEIVERTDLQYVVERMRLEDIPQVVDIERQAFPSPWPARAYRYEVTQNRLAHYFVARSQTAEEVDPAPEAEGSLLGRLQTWTHRGHADRRPIVGYCGFWVMAQEAHISTIAVDPQYRGLGIGQLLLVTAIDKAIELDATLVSLEVRVSNFAAQKLYRKYGFKIVGRRPRYYSDNREDALIMTADHIASVPYQRVFQKQRNRVFRRLERNASLGHAEQPRGSSVPLGGHSPHQGDDGYPDQDLHQEGEGS